MKYCIPLTSAKKRHLGWKNVSRHNIVIYEVVSKSKIHKNDIYKRLGTTDRYKKNFGCLGNKEDDSYKQSIMYIYWFFKWK